MGHFTDKTSKKIEFDKLKIVRELDPDPEYNGIVGWDRYILMFLPKGKWDISRNWVRCPLEIFDEEREAAIERARKSYLTYVRIELSGVDLDFAIRDKSLKSLINSELNLLFRDEKLVRKNADRLLEQGYIDGGEEYTNTEWP